MISNTKINIYKYMFVLFCFLCFLFPSTLRVVRLLLLLLLVMVSVVSVGGTIQGEGIKRTAIFVIIKILFGVYGAIVGGQMAIRYLAVDVLWPVLFCIIVQPLTRSKNEIVFLFKTMMVLELLVAILDLSMIFSTQFGINLGPIMSWLKSNETFMLGKMKFFQYYSDAQRTHIFMFPFVSILLFYKPKLINRKIVIVCFVLSLICFLFTMRVGFYISATSSLLLVIIVSSLFDRRNNDISIYRQIEIIVFICIVLVIIQSVKNANLGDIINYIRFKLESSRTIGSENTKRALMSHVLIEGWLESPIWGHGLGTFPQATDGIDWVSVGMEYSYHVVLYREGIVGIFNLIFYYGWIALTIFKGIKKNAIDRWLAYPFLAGLMSAIIANGSNPYLNTMGSMWMVFLPFAVANYVSKQSKPTVFNDQSKE